MSELKPFDEFMEALVNCDTVKVILTGCGESVFDTKTIYEGIRELWNRRTPDIGNAITETNEGKITLVKPIEIDQFKNEPLSCKGCEYHDENAEWPERCYECIRKSRGDLYRQKPEAKEGTQ